MVALPIVYQGYPNGVEPSPSGSQPDMQNPLHQGHHVLNTKYKVRSTKDVVVSSFHTLYLALRT